jgi:hypothetical protein
MPKETQGSSTAVRAFIFAEAGSPRLRPLTEHLPTSLLPVGGIPLLDRQIQALLKCDVRDITVVGGYRAAQVEQACRFYSAVGFRFNPRFSRLEPRLNALRASGPLGKDSVLLICGSLFLDRPLLGPVLASKPNAVLVAERKPIGLYHLLPDTAQALQEAGEEALANGGAERDLFEFIEDFMDGMKHTRLQPECPWARLRSMEDLAQALKSHPVPPQMPAAARPKPGRGVPPPPSPPPLALLNGRKAPEPPGHLEGPGGEVEGLSHPLLKVFPR